MSSGSQFIQLEEFDESLRGRRICAWVPHGITGTGLINHIRLIISNIQANGDEPFNKIICLTNDATFRLLADSLGATMIIGPKDNNDLSITLTAINQAPSHTLLIVFPDVSKCPDQFYQRIPSSATLAVLRPADDTTVIGSCNIFMMPYVREIESGEHHNVNRRIHALGITHYDLTAVLKELRMAKAGLLVSMHSDAYVSRRHELYWWNTAEELPIIRRKPEVISDLLHFIAHLVH
jgi:hypothetical protein